MQYLITQVWYSDLSEARPNPGSGDRLICDTIGNTAVFEAGVTVDRTVGIRDSLWLIQATIDGQVWFSWGLREALSPTIPAVSQ